MIFVLVASVLLLFYLVMVITFTVSWKKLPEFDPSHHFEQKKISVSIVVCCHNEEEKLPQLLSALLCQTHSDYELVMVDDHSTDGTYKIMQEFCSRFPKVKYFQSELKGKKHALQEAVDIASGELIITTDADCEPRKNWVETICNFYWHFHPDLIIAPVELKSNLKIFQQLQKLEFASLAASGAGAAAFGKPILCNGANLAFPKKIYSIHVNDLHNELLSGDDMFLLESVKNSKGEIRFLKSTLAMVETKVAENLSTFFRQRKRWSSKFSAYRDKDIIAVALLVFLTNFSLLCFFVLSLITPTMWTYFIVFFVLKYLIDSSFLYSVRKFFGLRNVWFYAFLLSLIYPFYVVITAFSGVFSSQKNWE